MKLKLSEIKSNPKNPRVIKDTRFAKLVNSLIELPVMTELREVILDENGVIIGGNMRYKAAQEAGWEEINVKYFTKEDADRNNKLTNQNKSYEEYVEEITIKDNVSGGDWDWEVLANEWNSEQLDDWGLEVPINDRIENMEDGDEIEFEQSVQIEPPQEYIMIIAEPNSVEWEELKEKIKLKMVRRGGYKKGSAFDSVGLERVIDWKDFKDRYDSSSTE